MDATRNARIADFGLATVSSASINFTATASMRGTLRWMSPELLDLDESADLETGRPTPAADIYALAMVMWEVLASGTIRTAQRT